MPSGIFNGNIINIGAATKPISAMMPLIET
jgi:hypothetical protein